MLRTTDLLLALGEMQQERETTPSRAQKSLRKISVEAMNQNLSLQELLEKEFDSVAKREFPLLHVDEEADCFEVFLTDEAYYGERVDGRVTIYRGQESGELVGILLKGAKNWVARILSEFNPLRYEIVDGKIKLGLLFIAAQSSEENSPYHMTYREIAQKAWQVTMVVPECDKVTS
jgi:hypothetical protein